MSLTGQLGQWFVPPAFHPILKRWIRLKQKQDINEIITPIQLRHIRRYYFAGKYIQGDVVLDAACGSGYGSDLLEPIKEYIGVDYADYCIRYAQENYSGKHRRFIEIDLYSLGKMFPPKSFDSIISFETLEHLDKPEKVLSTFFELLRPSGKLIVSIPLNHPDIIYHKRQYTHGEIRTLFKPFISSSVAKYEEYLQEHLRIIPLTTLLLPESTGTWLGILTMKPLNNS